MGDDHKRFTFSDFLDDDENEGKTFVQIGIEIEEELKRQTLAKVENRFQEFEYNDKINYAVATLQAAYEILTKNMNDDAEKRVILVLFLERAFLSCNTEEAIIGGGGKFGEILAAYQRGCIMNTKMTGVDMVHSDTGEPQEQKTSTTAAGKKANFNFTIPARASPNTTDNQYKKAVIANFTAKGDVYFTHRKPKSQETHNYYLSKEFVAELMWHKYETNKTLRVNLGADPCKHCKLVHRMVHYMKLDEEWSKLSDKSTFDWSRTEEKIPSSSNCKDYEMTKTK